MGSARDVEAGRRSGTTGRWRRLALSLVAVAAVAGVLAYDPGAPPADAQRVEELDVTVRAVQWEEDTPGRAGKRCRQIYLWSIPNYPFADQILVQFVLPNYGSVTSPTNQNNQAETIIPGSDRAKVRQQAITRTITYDGRARVVELAPAITDGGYHGGFRSSYGDATDCGFVPSWLSGYSTDFSFVAWFGPTPAFSWEVTDAATREVTFTSTSIDEDGTPAVTHAWDFGDGASASDRNPVHRFPGGGSYPVTLVVTQADGEQETLTLTVTVPAGDDGIVVNSTGDDPAEDPAASCDTGATIGDAPECTLRAAIQVANERGGDDIAFAIPGAGTPTIQTTIPLPKVTASTTIDGTSQPGGWVAVAATGERGIDLSGGASTIEGLVVRGATSALVASGGADHVIEGNRVGLDAAGSADAATEFGVAVNAPGTEVRGNVSGSLVGLGTGPAATGLEVVDNRFGVDDDGATPLGEPRVGVAISSPGASVEGNVVRGDAAGVIVLGAAASGATVADNQVGVTGAGTATLPGMGVGIRVDGAPGATVTGNHVWGEGEGAIQVTGSAQYTVDDEGRIELEGPSGEPLVGPVAGGAATIADNVVGLAGGDADITSGIVTWAGAGVVTVSGNTVHGADDRGIQMDGGSGHRIEGNVLGTASEPVATGIALTDVVDARVGGAGELGNEVVAEVGGASIEAPTGSLLVQGNRIAVVGDEPEAGVAITGEAAAPVIAGNVIDGAEEGIVTAAPGATVTNNAITGAVTAIDVPGADVVVTGNDLDEGTTGIDAGGPGATITGNDVTDQEGVGIDAGGDDATVSANSVVSSGTGLALAGEDVTAEDNRIGLARVGTTVVGNLGTGISVTGGSALLRGNLVAGSGGDGISVSASATAEVRRTRIWESAQEPIAAPGAPAAPTIEAAIRSGSGETLRRTLVLTELPEGDAGRIEVFANASCDDPEAELLLSIERTKGADETARIVQVPEAPDRDHFTVTYTSAAGRTSEVSNCASGDTYPDADGDGSVDPLDEVLGAADDATSAIIPTDTEQLLLLKVAPYDPDTDEGGGSLESVSIGEDPAPDSHPAGWGLPYGALSFRISGLEPGGRTTLVMAAISGTEAIAGTSYWKYGPEVPGGASSWYDFAYDEATETGAVLTSADVAGAIRKAFALRFADGARGDSDGGANGSITDPGGPVFFEGDVSPTTTTTTTTSSPSTSTPAGPTTTVDAPTTTASGAPGGGAGPDGGAGPVDDGTLPRTGTDAGWPLALGAALVLLGGVALGARRARLAR